MTFRMATDEDIPQITELLVSAFPRQARTDRFWLWANRAYPSVAVVAQVGGRIVGHYSFRSEEFVLGSKTLHGAYGQQAAVHEDYRDLKTAVALIREAQNMAAQICDFAYAFPNRSMAPVKERLLEWTNAGVITAWGLDLSDYLNALAKHESQAGLEVRRLRAPSTVAYRQAGFAPAHTMVVAKDANWLRWRYLEHPVNHYAVFGAYEGEGLVGHIVAKVYLDGELLLGHILELSSGEPAVWPLLRAAGEFFQFMKARQVVVWNEDFACRDLFARMGFEPTDRVTTLHVKPLRDTCPDLETVSWSFDMGCSDVF